MTENPSSHTPEAVETEASAPTPEVSPRARAILIAITVVVGLVIAAIPLIAGLQGTNDDQAPLGASEHKTDATPTNRNKLTSGFTSSWHVPKGKGNSPRNRNWSILSCRA